VSIPPVQGAFTAAGYDVVPEGRYDIVVRDYYSRFLS